MSPYFLSLVPADAFCQDTGDDILQGAAWGPDPLTFLVTMPRASPREAIQLFMQLLFASFLFSSLHDALSDDDSLAELSRRLPGDALRVLAANSPRR